MFAEAYRAEAQDFKVNAPCYSLHAWLDWRLNFDDPMQIQSAPLHPEPICNHTDMVANESEPYTFSNFLQNVDIPPDNPLDHSQHLASVDGIPGSLHPSRLERCSVLGSAYKLERCSVLGSASKLERCSVLGSAVDL